MKKARLIITMDCPRKCPGCCNEYPSLKALMQPTTLYQLFDYDEVMITGGEPMLYPDRIKHVIEVLRDQRKDRPVFLYTALQRRAMWELLPLLDGVQFTLHAGAGEKEIEGLHDFQAMIRGPRGTGSYRLYIDPRVTESLVLWPDSWSRVEVKPWMEEGECPLPDGESLLVLQQ